MRQDTASHARCLFWIACCLCTLLSPASVFARVPALPVRQPVSGFQGENVYVLEGRLGVIEDDSLRGYRDFFVFALYTRTIDTLSEQGQAGCAVLKEVEEERLLRVNRILEVFCNEALQKLLAAAYHAYAEGVVASQRIPNLLTLLNQLCEEDWKEAAEELHTAAANVETELVQDLTNTAPLAAAVQLGLEQTTEELFVDPVTGMVFVPVPAGKFEMGSTEKEVDAALALCHASYGNCERSWFAVEQPQHTVTLDAYWIGQTEVTNAQFQQFVDAGGYATERYWSAEGWQVRSDEGWEGPRCLEEEDLNAPNLPVVCVSWYEAEAYTRWLSEASGAAIRLPTEAEWEKAARGTEGRIFPWGDEFDGSWLNFCDVNCEYDWKDETFADGYTYTASVGSYPEGVSPYGAPDMAGNVWEWVNDRYDGSDYSVSPGSNLQGPATGKFRLLRGGSWSNISSFVRSAFRLISAPDDWSSVNGFRCARSQ